MAAFYNYCLVEEKNLFAKTLLEFTMFVNFILLESTVGLCICPLKKSKSARSVFFEKILAALSYIIVFLFI